MDINKQNICNMSTWVLSLFIVFVFSQSLFFKFSNAPETQYIFATLNQWALDSFGIKGLFIAPGIFNQYVIGTLELTASVLLLLGLITRFKVLNVLGALLAFGVISGAIFFHLFTPLGIGVQGDGGALFTMAVGIWISSLILIYKGRNFIMSFMS